MHEELQQIIEALTVEREARMRFGQDTSIVDGLLNRAQMLRYLPEDLVSAMSAAAHAFARELA